MTPRLPQVTAKELIAALKHAGFELDHQTGSHADLYNPVTRRQTVVPMHAGDIGRGLLKKIIKQAGLTEDTFRDLL